MSAHIPALAGDGGLWCPLCPSHHDDRHSLGEHAIAAHPGTHLAEQSRADRAEQRVVELEELLGEVLRTFVYRGHPGRACLQSGWIPVETVNRWRTALGRS